MNKRVRILLSLSFFMCLSANLYSKTIHYVKVDGTGDGTSWTDASGNIQTMIDKAVSGDEVWVAKGTYYPTTETITGDTRSRTFVLKDSVNTYGGFAGTETAISQRALSDLDGNGKVDSCEFVNATILSGDIDGVTDVWTKVISSEGKKRKWKWIATGNEANCYHVVTGGASTASFDGFSVIGGNATSAFDDIGGGIYAQLAIIANCTVSDCSASNAGGIGASSIINCTVSNCSDLYIVGGIEANSVTNCIVSNCSDLYGAGGIEANSVTNCIVSNCSDLYGAGGIEANLVTNCTVSNCSASSTGGIYADSVTNCTVSNCSASKSGGGIHAFSATNCIISNCSASEGGGIYASSVTNCTVSNCSASESGGIDANLVTNCTVSNCLASNSGGGIYAENDAVVRNCAVSNNEVGNVISNITGDIQSDNISPDISATYINPTSFVGTATTDAQKAELLTANWRLCKGSPCINAGTSVGVSSSILSGKDIDGNPRVKNDTIDIGAYEYIADTGTAIDQIQTSNKYSYSINDGELVISNLDTGALVEIYNINGILLTSESAVSETVDYKLPVHGIYLIHISSNSKVINKKVAW